MDHQAITSRRELERILFDESAKPRALSLPLLEQITSQFSDDKEIGNGGFARVYKGMLENGIVAVKKLFQIVDIDEKKFSDEVRCLMKANHKNIVRFLGYCCDTQGKMVNYEKELVLAEVRQRLLCFEYLPEGSLDKQITDASCGLEWGKRYQIISGICDGLYYLHQQHIVHLDLKPANILLDDNMMPKIIDFGLSRCFDENQSRAVTSKLVGTMGYMAPEFFGRGNITFKSDIYSLGIIIIEILTGDKGCPRIDNVLESWGNRLDQSHLDTQLVQVRVCAEVAMECTDFNPAKRPDTQDIIDRLGATQNADEFATEIGADVETKNSNANKSSYDNGSFRKDAEFDSRNDSSSVDDLTEPIKFLMDLVPGSNKVIGKAAVLDETRIYVESLQRQVEFLSMKLATVNPHLDFNKLPGSVTGVTALNLPREYTDEGLAGSPKKAALAKLVSGFTLNL